ncbi:hypothetical protein N202_07890 [Helicobacter pylori UM067]|nr:hypothetical protein N202_07890 [Helicobacter pylori UM067]
MLVLNFLLVVLALALGFLNSFVFCLFYFSQILFLSYTCIPCLFCFLFLLFKFWF